MKKRRVRSDDVAQALKAYYQAPEPVERETFLAGLGAETGRFTRDGRPAESGCFATDGGPAESGCFATDGRPAGMVSCAGALPLRRFFAAQASYIRRRNWVLAVGFFLAALLLVQQWGREAVWVVAAFAPLLALSMVTEGNRSARFGMEELELSTRFSLKTVILARFGILGTGNLLLVGLVVPLALCFVADPKEMDELSGFWEIAACLLVPFLFTTFACLAVVRRFRGSEGGWICCGITVLISLFSLMVGMAWVPTEGIPTEGMPSGGMGAEAMPSVFVLDGTSMIGELAAWLHQPAVMELMAAALTVLAVREGWRLIKEPEARL